MLVFTVRASEAFRVGDDIRVSVERSFHHSPSNTKQVQLGIEAPAAIPVLRAELHDAQSQPGDESSVPG